ncbi:MAG: carbohydrate ABC transporter permease, partial [Parvibaculum sp.]
MIRRVLFNLMAWAIVLAVAFPLFWMVVTSLKPQSELFMRPPTILPDVTTFEHYWRLLSETNFLTYFQNSVVLSVVTTVV